MNYLGDTEELNKLLRDRIKSRSGAIMSPPERGPAEIPQDSSGSSALRLKALGEESPNYASLGNEIMRSAAQAFVGDTPAEGDEISPVASPIDFIAGEIPAMARAAPMILGNEIGAIRLTRTGKLLGTVEPELMTSNKLVQEGLREQAIDKGLKFGGQAAIKADEVAPSLASKATARFGDEVPSAYWQKLQASAEKRNAPYEPIIIKGKQAGFYPNENVTPTGMVGNPKDFASGDAHKIFARDPLGWYDQKYGVSKQLLEKHSEAGIPANITTAADLIARDDYIAAIPEGSQVNLVLTYPLEGEFVMGHPTPSIGRMLTAYDKLKKSGVNAQVLIPDPATRSLKPLDPFTLRKLQVNKNAFWSPSEE